MLPVRHPDRLQTRCGLGGTATLSRCFSRSIMKNASETVLPAPTVIDSLATPQQHAALWQACMEKRWYFGNYSVSQAGSIPFWKMDLDGDPATAALWAHARR